MDRPLCSLTKQDIAGLIQKGRWVLWQTQWKVWLSSHELSHGRHGTFLALGWLWSITKPSWRPADKFSSKYKAPHKPLKHLQHSFCQSECLFLVRSLVPSVPYPAFWCLSWLDPCCLASGLVTPDKLPAAGLNDVPLEFIHWSSNLQ